METKILWQYDSTFEQTGGGSSGEDKKLILKNMLEFAQSVARPTTEIVMDFPTEAAGKHFPPYMRYNRALLAVEMLERVKQAEDRWFRRRVSGGLLRRVFSARSTTSGQASLLSARQNQQ